jgi:hypothetical protein
MGVVIDFIGFVLRRSGRHRALGRGRPAAVAVATFDEGAFRGALAQLDRAQPSEVIVLGAGLAAACLKYGDDRRRVANVAMQAFPDAAWILSFDGDGYVRAAALQRLTSPACSTGRFIAIALRLNDWAPQVRTEAADAAKRVWPATSADVVAGAASYLLRQRFAWKRWAEEALCVDEVLGRPDVALAVTSLLLRGQFGALGRTLSQALRFPAYDIGLVNLATKARLPDVRARAMKTILSGKAVWPVGYDWAWVDKSMGERQRVVRTESRSVSVPASPNLVEVALADRSALVRKIAADDVIERMCDLPGIAEIASLLANDKSAAVRGRADYIKRHLNTPVDAASI